ncbi:MAG TPA: penicillin-binding transpeptidase domain-containing protein [Candidatus Sumerlaeota bacterium]|nr:penicillin-binding transpeptidase domain-containing protein [Candidatus Sumerlaeota bacterium]
MPLYQGPQSPPDFFGDKQKTVQENKSFFLRVAVLVLLVLIGFGFLVLRITYLTVGRGQQLAELSEQNYLRQVSIPAPRGALVDRNGQIIAHSVTRFNLSISPFDNQEADLAYTLDAVRSVCPAHLVPEARTLTAAEIVEKPKKRASGDKRERPSRDRWKPIPLATNLTLEQITPLMERLVLLPGLLIEPTFQRIYPFGRETGHLTGYMGKIPEKSRELYTQEKGYELDDLVGVAGLERAFEEILCGQKGSEFVYRNAAGRIVRTLPLKGEEPIRGGQVTLTLDLDLQRAVNRILDTQTTASIVVMDPRNGDILAIASKPNYDANHPELISRKHGNDSFCRALSGSYWPGSTFKMITATAWLQNTGADPTRVIECDRRYFYGKGPKDYLTCLYSHGGENLKSALKVSCNVYFYTAAAELELDPFLKTCADFGFGKPTGVQIGGRSSAGRLGLLRPHMTASRIDRIKLGIGQGELLKTTPLQMTIAYCAMANGGSRYEAHIVHETRRPGEQAQLYAPTVLSQIGWTQAQHNAIEEGLKAVVYEENGTGRYGKFPKEWKVAGKTGTAQKGKGRPVDAWFACYAPSDNPEVCIVVLVEDAGGHGGEISSPVAKEVLNDYYRLRFERTGQAVPGGPATLTVPPVPNLTTLPVESGSVDGEDDDETTRTSPASLLQTLPTTLAPPTLAPPPLPTRKPGLSE